MRRGSLRCWCRLPTAADDHQRRNAEVLEEAGAAEMLLQRDVTPESLKSALVALLNDGPRRAVMAERARSLAKPGALEKIAAMVLRLAEETNRRAEELSSALLLF